MDVIGKESRAGLAAAKWGAGQLLDFERIRKDSEKIARARESGDTAQWAWAEVDKGLSEAKLGAKLAGYGLGAAAASGLAGGGLEMAKDALGTVSPGLKWAAMGWSSAEEGLKSAKDVKAGHWKAGAARLLKAGTKAASALCCMGVAGLAAAAAVEVGVPALGVAVVAGVAAKQAGKLAKKPLDAEEELCKRLESAPAQAHPPEASGQQQAMLPSSGGLLSKLAARRQAQASAVEGPKASKALGI